MSQTRMYEREWQVTFFREDGTEAETYGMGANILNRAKEKSESVAEKTTQAVLFKQSICKIQNTFGQ